MSANKSTTKKHTTETSKKVYENIKSIFFTVLLVMFISSAVVEGSLTPTPSMEGTIKVGDRMFINKFVFGASTPTYIPFTDIELPYFRLPAFREPERNEILVFRYPGELNQLKDDKVEFWVKRCIGTPGDIVEIRDKVIFVNGEQFPIPPHIQYKNQPIKQKGSKNTMIFPSGNSWNEDNYGPLRIPGKGDLVELNVDNIEQWRTLINREHGRNVVDVKDSQIYIDGIEAENYEVKEDYYFMVGDNRDDSYDSRFWGYVPRENIVGTPLIIFWSWDSDIPFYNVIDKIGSIRFDRLAKLVK